MLAQAINARTARLKAHKMGQKSFSAIALYASQCLQSRICLCERRFVYFKKMFIIYVGDGSKRKIVGIFKWNAAFDRR